MENTVKIGEIYKQASGDYPAIRREVIDIQEDQITYRVYNIACPGIIEIAGVEVYFMPIVKTLPLERFLMNSVLTHDFKN